MRPLLVCDACSIRRVKCDGKAPCARCVRSSLECRRLRTRKKMGPKTVHKKTLGRLASAGVHQRWLRDQSESLQAGTNEAADGTCSIFDSLIPDHSSIPDHDRCFSLNVLRVYLDIYRAKMFPVWPVVDVTSLVERMEVAPFDVQAYMLASSVCTATILQLQLAVDGSGMPTPQSCVDEIESMRNATQYRQRPTLDSVLTSFFLHISYLHLGQRMVSTLLLREAITMSHLLNLHQQSHYAGLPHAATQMHLRVIWLLFITER